MTLMNTDSHAETLSQSLSRPPSGKRRALAIVAVLAVVAVSWLGVIDRYSKDYVNSATVQALTAFATARMLNAGISVAKSLEVSIPVVGGVAIQPFQVLDPINDLVEQYSTIMQVAIASLVTQKILIEIVASELFKILLTLAGLVLIISFFIKGGSYSGLFMKAFALAGLVRFLFALVVLLNGIIDQGFVDQKTVENMHSVQVTAEQVQSTTQPNKGVASSSTTGPYIPSYSSNPNSYGLNSARENAREHTKEKRSDESGWLDSVRQKLKSATDFGALADKLENTIISILNLMAIFLLKTLILPLVFLLLLLRGFRAIWGIDPRTLLRQSLAPHLDK